MPCFQSTSCVRQTKHAKEKEYTTVKKYFELDQCCVETWINQTEGIHVGVSEGNVMIDYMEELGYIRVSLPWGQTSAPSFFLNFFIHHWKYNKVHIKRTNKNICLHSKFIVRHCKQEVDEISPFQSDCQIVYFKIFV